MRTTLLAPWLVPSVALAIAAPASAQVGSETVGVNAHLPDASVLDACEALGVEWIRIDVNWRDVHTGPGAFDWSLVDQAADGAAARGLSVFATLAYTPDWVPRVSRTRTDAYGGNDQPASSAEWVAFVTEAAQHLRAHGVTHLGLWNEANLDGFWEDAAGIDAWVDTILIPGAGALRAACSDCVVVGPELANVGEADVALDRVLTRAPAGTFDVISHHIYQTFGTSSSDSFLNVLEDRRSPVTRASLREVLDLHGWQGEVWISETGYEADPPGDPVEEAAQEDFVSRVLDAQLERAWWTASFFYEISDCGVDAPDCPIDGFGLARPLRTGARTWPADYRRKPAFDAIAGAIAGRPELVGDGPVHACANGSDDDGDGRTDLEDRGCASQIDDVESDDPARRTITGLSGEVILDGTPDPGAGAEALTLTLDDWVAARIAPGPLLVSDLGADVAARWSEGRLVITVAVSDDEHAPSASAAAPWEGDSIQVAIDADGSGGDAYDADDREWTIWLDGTTQVLGEEIEAAVGRTGRGTYYELAIPMPGISPGRQVRFSVLVNESDGDGREGWIELTPGIGLRKQPESFGEIVITGRGVPLGGDGGLTGGEPASGCGCGVARARPPLALALALVTLAALRRRRAR